MSVLLLLHPTVVTNEELVESTKAEIAAKFPGAPVTQHIIDRVANNLVELLPALYNNVVYVNPNKNNLALPTAVIAKLYDALTSSGELLGDLPTDQDIDALMSGFIVTLPGVWSKPAPVQSVSLKKRTPGVTKTLPAFKKIQSSPAAMTDTLDNTDDEDGLMKRKLDDSKLAFFSGDLSDDELIDENDLIDSRKLGDVVVPKKCELPSGKRRKKACKDCTCGLKELEEQEELQAHSLQETMLGKMAQLATLEAMKIEERLKTIKFTEDDLTEIDFTVEGKTGGCGSCALGDAFRCDGCPYLGLPPFKPGQAITLDSFGEDI